jgi:hypothetical protein
MHVTIEEIHPDNVHDIHRCDGEFIIDSKLLLRVEEGKIRYTITELPFGRI